MVGVLIRVSTCIKIYRRLQATVHATHYCIITSTRCLVQALMCRQMSPVVRQPYCALPLGHDPVRGQMDRVCPHYSGLHRLLEKLTEGGSSDAHPLFTVCYSRGTLSYHPGIPARANTVVTPQAKKFRENFVNAT